MRTTITGLTLGSLLLGAAAAGAQAPSQTPTQFSGIKLVDMKARVPEQSVVLMFDRDTLRVVDPVSNADLRTFAYAGLKVTHTVSSAPPASAGNPSAVATQPMAPPMYMGKTPRNWLTLSSGGDVATLRVSAKVYAQVKAALEERRVAVTPAS